MTANQIRPSTQVRGRLRSLSNSAPRLASKSDRLPACELQERIFERALHRPELAHPQSRRDQPGVDLSRHLRVRVEQQFPTFDLHSVYPGEADGDLPCLLDRLDLYQDAPTATQLVHGSLGHEFALVDHTYPVAHLLDLPEQVGRKQEVRSPFPT